MIFKSGGTCDLGRVIGFGISSFDAKSSMIKMMFIMFYTRRCSGHITQY